MSLIRLLPAWLHAIADYAVGALLVVAALVVGGSGAAIATGVVVGVVILVVSMLTKYPLGVVKVLPFTLHSAGDYLATALLLIAPFALRFNHSDTGLTVLYIGAGVAVLAVSLITDYQYAPANAAASPVDMAERVSVSQRTPAAAATTKRRTRPLVANGRSPRTNS